MQKTILFEARQSGYHSYRIPGLAIAGSRILLAYCEGRKNDPWDYGHIDILLRRSFDGGREWTEPMVLVSGEASTANNAVMIGTKNSPEVHFLYCRKYQKCFYAKSLDAGTTFSSPVEISGIFEEYRKDYNWTLIATGPGHGLQLRSGRLLVPVWLSMNKEQTSTMVSVIYSDDNGRHWQRGPIIVRDDDGQGLVNPMEAVVVELWDGRVMMNVRNRSMPQRRAVAISPDGVNAWTAFHFDSALREPFCFGSICRWENASQKPFKAILWTNPDNVTCSTQPGTAEIGGADRKRLTVKMSIDDGQTWPFTRVLEPEWSGYSDLIVGPHNTIYCFYECGCLENLMWDIQSLCLAHFPVEWAMKLSKRNNKNSSRQTQ